MSEIKTLEELRHHAHVLKGGSTDYNELFEIADKIEAEIAERFMELPVDADGVPIHVGDEIECHANGYDGTFTVFAINNNVAVGNHDIEWIRRNPSKWFHVASFCTHVKQRTLEDVLNDCAAEIRELLGVSDNRTTELLKEYAFALRRLEYDAGKPGSNMTLGEYETEEKKITDEYSQAIAATLGGGECEVVVSSTDGLMTAEPRKWFELSCGHAFKLDGLDAPVACPVCGKAVKR